MTMAPARPAKPQYWLAFLRPQQWSIISKRLHNVDVCWLELLGVIILSCCCVGGWSRCNAERHCRATCEPREHTRDVAVHNRRRRCANLVVRSAMEPAERRPPIPFLVERLSGLLALAMLVVVCLPWALVLVQNLLGTHRIDLDCSRQP